jgi:hypothetical protein
MVLETTTSGSLVPRESMSVLSTGNVGIGTTEPLARLVVAGSGSTTARAFEIDDNVYSPKVVVLDNGNVGIGTTVPNNTIQVAQLIDFNNTDGNTKIGYQAGLNIVASAQFNTFVGYQAGLSSAVSSTNAADFNTAVGYQAMSSNTTGALNTATGYGALAPNTTGFENVAYGAYALTKMTTGSRNIALGSYAGRYIADNATGNTNGTNSIFLGHGARPFADGDTNEIVIGFDFNGNGSNSVTLGNDSITKTILKGNVGVGTTAPLSKLVVVGTGSTTARAFEIDNNLYSPKVVVLDNGNVGIGTITPISALQISSNGAGFPNSGATLWLDDTDPAVDASVDKWGLVSDAGTFSIISTNNTFTAGYAPISIVRATNSPDIARIVFSTALGSERARIDSNGNVGIGTTAPFAKVAIVGVGSTTARAFEIDDNLYSPKVVVLDNGNVGIGTTTPVQKLEVKGGAILGTEASVTTAASMTVNWVNGNQQYVALNQAGHTISFSNYQVGQVLRLIVCQDATGGRTVTTWDTSTVWASGTAPTLTATASKCDVISFVCTNAKGTVKTFGTMTANF